MCLMKSAIIALVETTDKFKKIQRKYCEKYYNIAVVELFEK